MIDQNSVKQAVDAAAKSAGAKSYLFIYFDGDKARFTGEMSISTFMPLISEYLLGKLSGQGK